MTESRILSRHDVIGGGIEFSIWGNTSKLQLFFTGIDKALDGPSVDRVVTVASHKRRRYPGDAGYTVQSHARKYTPEIGSKGRVTPGRNFYCELPILNVGTGDLSYDVFQFTHTGPVIALRAYATSNAADLFRLRSESGRWIDVDSNP